MRGRHHPALSNLLTNWDVMRSRPHLKFLAGNYLTYQIRASQSGGSEVCRLCDTGQPETVPHIIATCSSLESERNLFLSDFGKLCALTKNNINLDYLKTNEEDLCQFILDPSSLNLSSRVNIQDPILSEFFRLSRDTCYILDKTRTRLLNELLRK